MVALLLRGQGLVVGYVITDYRAQKFVELLICSDVFKSYAFNGEAVVFLHIFSFLFVIFIWFLCYFRVTRVYRNVLSMSSGIPQSYQKRHNFF